MTKRISALLLFSLLLMLSTACHQDRKQEVQQLLSAMRKAYEAADYSGVRLLADSLHNHYATDTVARREALTLSREAECKEAERNMQYADSMLRIVSARIDSLAPSFKKNTPTESGEFEYFLAGFGPAPTEERTRLRCRADTLGQLHVLSVYVGSKSILHTALRLSDAQTKSSIQTADVPFDGALNYRFADLGLNYELVTYPQEETAKLADFFMQADSEGHALRAELLSKGKVVHSFPISRADVKALSSTARIRQLFDSRQTFRHERAKAQKRITYLKEKLDASVR